MDRLASVLVSKRNLPKFAAATIFISSLTGWIGLKYVGNRRKNLGLAEDGRENTSLESKRDGEEMMTRDEAILRAMIQNAKESDWRENLSNASFAHKRFVLPGNHHSHKDDCDEHKQGEEQFFKKIMDKSDEMMEQQRKELEKRKLAQEQQKTEKFSSWRN